MSRRDSPAVRTSSHKPCRGILKEFLNRPIREKSRTLLWAATLLFGILLQTGCATAGKQGPSPLRQRCGLNPTTRSLPPVVASQAATRNVDPQAPAMVEQPQTRESPSSTLSRLLPKTCVAMEVTPTILLVKSGTPMESPSLFEEAIALSKLRGLLGAKPGIPKDTPRKTRLQNGTATIPFGKSVSPADAAAAVMASLSVDGVQRVRAVMDVN